MSISKNDVDEPPLRLKSSATPANLGLFPGAPVVREVKKRNYLCAVDGDGGDHKALGDAPFRSLLERDLRTLLGANPDIAHYAVEPHELTYFIPDGRGGQEKHVYVPDVVCRYRAGSVVVIDAKARFIAELPAWTRRQPHIEEAYRLDHGVAFLTLDEAEIRAEPRLSNAQIMERHRYIVPDAVALLRVRDALVTLGLPTTIAAVVRAARLNDRPGECRAYTAVLNLALAGEVALDLARPLSFQAEIREVVP
ncbi:hypothetical protein ACFQE0_20480 [Methylobacterium komagatae]|uniref:TnsA endonuclease N-terminal domain-containing protein n=1 Tax=Methylobacterium komagatae TaxID=374425 RepID=A0ABW2BPU3_9HYPH|nr:hypothetical protein [Methylobacterium organophilum]PVZ05263.1 hypothetical protein C7388_105257 [Methylobacterium organophilum]